MTSKAKCSVCNKKPVDPDYRPFCSKRCADVDLGKWLKDGYAIPGAPLDEAEEVPEGTDNGGRNQSYRLDN